MNKRALIIGCTGQDASYLAESLLAKGYRVYGTIRRSSSFNTSRIDHIFDKLTLFYADLNDSSSILHAIQESNPDEVYCLAAMSHVKVSFDQPLYTFDSNASGILRILETIRLSKFRPKIYNAISSEIFGSQPPPQNELTPFHPRSPYGVSKAAAYWHGVNYREAYGMFICNGILYNHESPRRGETFVSRKITRAATRIKCGLQSELILGNIFAKRDWGYAPDFVEGMHLMLQRDEPDDFVLATGEQHDVNNFLHSSFEHLNLDACNYTKIDPKYYRPAEVDSLCGDYSKAERILGWEPTVKFNELVEIMIEHDLALAYNESRK